MNKKKGQIKFGETFGIIIIVFLVLMVAGVWYNNYMSKEVTKIEKKQQIDRAFEKYYYIVNSHLLHKSENGDIDEEYTTTNINAFYEYSNGPGREFIGKQLGKARITVDLLNSDFELEDTLTIYENVPKGYDVDETKNRKLTSVETYQTLIPVLDDINNNKIYVGKLKILVFN